MKIPPKTRPLRSNPSLGITLVEFSRPKFPCSSRAVFFTADSARHSADALGSAEVRIAMVNRVTFDLVLTSPPYEDARMYGFLRATNGQSWANEQSLAINEAAKVCNGWLVWVVSGRTRDGEYSLGPQRLAVEAAKFDNIIPRRPLIYKRFGIPGSGGKDYFRADHEDVLVFTTRTNPRPWADPLACGSPPKYASGGNPTHRTSKDARVSKAVYKQPKLANPGLVIDCCAVGGGHLGHRLAHENEAPFPLKLAEFFVKSFCPPGGWIYDPYGGSGTTAHAAAINGRNSVSIDIRQSQSELAAKRLVDIGGIIVAQS